MQWSRRKLNYLGADLSAGKLLTELVRMCQSEVIDADLVQSEAARHTLRMTSLAPELRCGSLGNVRSTCDAAEARHALINVQ